MTHKCALYRHFNKAGILLYVGISSSFMNRTANHRANAHWFEEIARIDVEWFASREAALWAEDVAIRQENPLHNRARPEGRKGPKSRNPEIELQRQVILREAELLGVKLSKIACLAVLEQDFAAAKAGLTLG